MRVTDIISKRFVGDPEVGKLYLGIARTLLGRMKASLGLIVGQAGTSGAHRWVLQDGVVIHTTTSPAGDAVVIDVLARRAGSETPAVHGLLLELNLEAPTPPLTNQRTLLADRQERFLTRQRLKTNTAYKAGNIDWVSTDRRLRITYNGAPSRSGFDIDRTRGPRDEVYSNGRVVAYSPVVILGCGVYQATRNHLIVMTAEPETPLSPVRFYAVRLPKEVLAPIAVEDWQELTYELPEPYVDNFQTHGFFSGSGAKASVVGSTAKVLTASFSEDSNGSPLISVDVDDSESRRVWVARKLSSGGGALSITQPVVIDNDTLVANARVPIACDYDGETLVLAKALVEVSGSIVENGTYGFVGSFTASPDPEDLGATLTIHADNARSGSETVSISLEVPGMSTAVVHRHAVTTNSSSSDDISIVADDSYSATLEGSGTSEEIDQRGTISYLNIQRRIALIGHATEKTTSNYTRTREITSGYAGETFPPDFPPEVSFYAVYTTRENFFVDDGEKSFTSKTTLISGTSTLREHEGPEFKRTIRRERTAPGETLFGELYDTEINLVAPPPSPDSYFYNYLDRFDTGLYAPASGEPVETADYVGSTNSLVSALCRNPQYLRQRSGSENASLQLYPAVNVCAHVPIQSKLGIGNDLVIAYQDMPELWGLEDYFYAESIASDTGDILTTDDPTPASTSPELFGDAYLDGLTGRTDLRSLFGVAADAPIYRLASF